MGTKHKKVKKGKRTSPKKEKKYHSCDDRLLKKEDRFSDKDIKTNWEILMRFNPLT